jgi:flagellar basal body P-ring protein FlgI
MGLLDKLRRRKKTDPSERRRQLLRHGRITDGVIIERHTSAAGNDVAIYSYTLNGVDFESADILSEEQRCDPVKYAPGARVNIRYDQRNQGNSVVE